MVGDKLYVNDAIGNVVVLDIQKEYVILFKENGQFVKANKYYYENKKLTWEHGGYYNNLTELIKSIEG